MSARDYRKLELRHRRFRPPDTLLGRLRRAARVRTTAIAGAVAIALALPAQVGSPDPLTLTTQSSPASDERLGVRVDLAVNGEALRDFARLISAETGVDLSVDPAIQDDKISLFCTDRPAYEAMEQAAKLFGHEWLAAPESEGYVLTPDARADDLEADLKAAAVGGVFEDVMSCVSDQAKLAGSSPQLPSGGRSAWEADAQRLAETIRAWGARVSPSGFRKLALEVLVERLCLDHEGVAPLLLRLTPNQIAMLKDGTSVVFSNDPGPGEFTLPPSLAPSFSEPPEAAGSAHADSGPLTHTRVIFKPSFDKTGVACFHLDAKANWIWEDGSRELQYLGTLSVPFCSRPEEIACWLAAHGPEGLRSRVSIPTWPVADPQGRLAAKVTVSARPLGSDSRTTLAPIWKELGAATVSDTLAQIAEQAGICIVADHCDAIVPSVELRGSALWVLHQLERRHACEMTQEGDWVRFRSTLWYLDRPGSVPNSYFFRWRAVERRKDGFDLSDLVEMSAVTDEQFVALKTFYWPSGVFRSMDESPSSDIDWAWVRALALCSDKDRRALLAGEALPVMNLGRPAIDAIVEILEDLLEGQNRERMWMSRLSCGQRNGESSDEGMETAYFRLDSPGWRYEWYFHLPRLGIVATDS